MQAISHRENLLRTLDRSDPFWVPYTLSMTPSVYEEFKLHTGQTDVSEHFQLGFRAIKPAASRVERDFSGYYADVDLPPGTKIDDWGVARRPGSMYHFQKMIHPMRDFDSPEQVLAYPLPDLDADYRFEGMADEAQSFRDRGYAVTCFAGHIFEYAWALRGMDNLLMDMVLRPKLAEALLDRITALDARIAEAAARAGADVIMFGDDVGTQRSMMMSPAMWREWLKPRLSGLTRMVKEISPDARTWYHSDGDVREIVPELIEAGVDILNPVQPECMDLAELVGEFGDDLLYWGALGTQTTMPFGRPEDVKDAVRQIIATAGPCGGVVIAPTHVLEPDVPWDNMIALSQIMGEFGHPMTTDH